MITKAEFEKKKLNLIKEFLEAKKQGNIGLGKSTSNLFRHRKSQTKKINVKHFNNVISIDEKNLFAEVEGMTTYEELVNETIRRGFLPTVVPELKSITIGGAYTGGGIESSSFKYGFVHETIIESEILLSSGKTVICTAKNKYKDLFFGFPNSYGSLGYVLRLKVKIVPIKKFVNITHIRTDPKELFSKLSKLIKEEKMDFIEGVVFSKNESYISIGKFVDQAPYENDYTHMKIYYKSLKKRKEDYVSTLNYIWRWDTDWFWCSRHFFVQNPLARLILGKKKLTSKTYTKIMRLNAKYKFAEKLHLTKKNTESVIQDVEIPMENASKFLTFFMDKIGILPIWVCPTKSFNPKVNFDLYTIDNSKLYFNFGFWDFVKSNKKDGFYNRMIENKVIELKGKKSLYSNSFFEEKVFWNTYNGKKYFVLKKKYDPDKVFLNLYEKTVLRK